MRSYIALVFIVGAEANLTIAAEQPASLHPVPGDAQDIVLSLEKRSYLIRLHLQVHGRSFRGNWDESIAHLFRYLDVDGDGLLSKKEAVLAPSKTQWVQLMTGTVVEPDAAPEFTDLAGSTPPCPSRNGGDKEGINCECFSRYYHNSGAGALHVEWGWRPPGQDHQSNTLFQLLDKDRDGSLSRGELLAAYTTLHRLDANGDDLIQATELPSGYYYPSFRFFPATDEQHLPAHFPFTLADKQNQPPDLELLVSLEQGARQDILILPGTDGKSNRLTALQPPIPDGALRIPVANKQLEVARYEVRNKERQELLKKFKTQADKDGVLDEKRIYQPPFTFVALLRLADRNGDNRLTHKELADYLDVQEKFLFRITYLTVVDRGASLFEFLDADHDGRLSPRELRTAWKRLSVWDRDKSGRIARRQVPRQFQLMLSYGASRSNRPIGEQGFPDLPLLRDRARGPLWFRKMDRNGDGDVSEMEFLGTSEQFRKIDRDGDGLIDAAEAERADAEYRKRQ